MRDEEAILERQIADRERRGVGVSTPERVRHSDLPFDAPAGAPQRIAMAPLDRLAGKTHKGVRIISKRLLDAGDRLRDDVYAAGLHSLPGMPLEPSDKQKRSGGYAYEHSERAQQALARVVRARTIGEPWWSIIGAVLWPTEYAATLEAIGKRLFGRSGKQAEAVAVVMLQIGLTRLAKHYEGRPLDGGAIPQ